MTRYKLMTPGPVPVPPETLEALGDAILHHRTPEFEKTFCNVKEKLKIVFGTSQPVFLHTTTGTGAMESAIVNTLSPGDQVIVVNSGKFGERWADMAESYGIQVHRIDLAWGQSLHLDQLKNKLEEFPQSKGVFCQACETSTGILHPISQIAQFLKQDHPEVLFFVDGITALGAIDLPMDDWGIDVLIGGSQKGFMAATGLSMISFSEKAWRWIPKARCPRYYFDIQSEKAAYDKNQTRFSSAVNLISALDRSLQFLLDFGLEKQYARTACLAQATTQAGAKFKLKTFPQTPSPSLTVFLLPENLDGAGLRNHIEKKYHITLMGGQDQLKGRVIRIGHMGFMKNEDLLQTIEAVGESLIDFGADIDKESVAQALKTADQVLKSGGQ